MAVSVMTRSDIIAKLRKLHGQFINEGYSNNINSGQCHVMTFKHKSEGAAHAWNDAAEMLDDLIKEVLTKWE